MDADQEKRVAELLAQIRAVMESSIGLSSDPRAVSASPPYRKLIAMGEPALETVVERLRAGDHFLNDAVLEMAHLQRSDLGLSGFPSEEQIASALVALFEPIRFDLFVTAVAAMPARAAQLATPAARISVAHQERPLSERIKKLIEPRA